MSRRNIDGVVDGVSDGFPLGGNEILGFCEGLKDVISVVVSVGSMAQLSHIVL